MWRIPAARMKMKADHLVPLSLQAVAVLGELQSLTGHGRYVFPSLRGASRQMSENTVNIALRSLGYDGDTMTGHGFRAMASIFVTLDDIDNFFFVHGVFPKSVVHLLKPGLHERKQWH